MYANSAPRANRMNDDPTNGIAIRRSFFVRPGTMNIQS